MRNDLNAQAILPSEIDPTAFFEDESTDGKSPATTRRHFPETPETSVSTVMGPVTPPTRIAMPDNTATVSAGRILEVLDMFPELEMEFRMSRPAQGTVSEIPTRENTNDRSPFSFAAVAKKISNWLRPPLNSSAPKEELGDLLEIARSLAEWHSRDGKLETRLEERFADAANLPGETATSGFPGSAEFEGVHDPPPDVDIRALTVRRNFESFDRHRERINELTGGKPTGR